MDVKICFKCKQKKPLKEFYTHPQMADGYLNKCKECNKFDAKEIRAAKLDYYKKYDRERASLPSRVKKRKEIAERWKIDPELKKRRSALNKEWKERNKLKRAAHVLTSNAIATKKLNKTPCEVCGVKKVEAYHDDYTKPLDVRWLCRKHHMQHHKEERERNRV